MSRIWSIASCAWTLTAAGAAAQARDPETIAAARTLAVDGVKLARAGECQRALEPLMRAEVLHHSSVVLAELGACHVQLGRLVAGSEALRRVVREGLPDSPSPAHQEALSRAERVLAEVLPKVAQLSVTINGPHADEVTLRIDEQPVPGALFGAARPTDPGLHLISASAPGFLPAQGEVLLSDGEKRSFELTLTPALESAAALPSATPDEPPAGPRRKLEVAHVASSTDGAGLRTAAYVSWAVGAAGLAVGAVFGTVARSDDQRLDRRCDGNLCPESERSEIVAAKRSGLISTIGIAAGAACIVAGTITYPFARRRERRAAIALSARLTLAGANARLQF